MDKYRNKEGKLKLVCIGNTFMNNNGYLIAKRHWADTESYHYNGQYLDDRYDDPLPDDMEPDELYWFNRYNVTGKDCVFKDNVCKGYNGLDVEEEVNDANILYSHEIN